MADPSTLYGHLLCCAELSSALRCGKRCQQPHYVTSCIGEAKHMHELRSVFYSTDTTAKPLTDKEQPGGWTRQEDALGAESRKTQHGRHNILGFRDNM